VDEKFKAKMSSTSSSVFGASDFPNSSLTPFPQNQGGEANQYRAGVSSNPVYATLNNVDVSQPNYTLPHYTNLPTFEEAFGQIDNAPIVPPAGILTRCGYCPEKFIKNTQEYLNHLTYHHRHVYNTCELPQNHQPPTQQSNKACSGCMTIYKDATERKLCMASHKVEKKTPCKVTTAGEEENQFKCPAKDCSAAYPSKKSLLAHGRRAHNMSFQTKKSESFSFQCQHCNRKISCAQSLLRHEESCKVNPGNKHKAEEQKLVAQKKDRERKKKKQIEKSGQPGGQQIQQGQPGGPQLQQGQHGGTLIQQGHGGPQIQQVQNDGPQIQQVQNGGLQIQQVQNGGPLIQQGQQGGPLIQLGQHGGPLIQQGHHGGPLIEPGQHGGPQMQLGHNGGLLIQPGLHGGPQIQSGQYGGPQFQQGHHGGSQFQPGQDGGPLIQPGQPGIHGQFDYIMVGSEKETVMSLSQNSHVSINSETGLID